jgi:hypothetical protein
LAAFLEAVDGRFVLAGFAFFVGLVTLAGLARALFGWTAAFRFRAEADAARGSA